MTDEKLNLTELQEKVDNSPEDSTSRFELGIAYGEAEQIDNAIEQLEKAVKLTPISALYHYNLAVAYGIKLRDDIYKDELWEDHTDEEELFELAISEYQKVIELDAEYVEAYNNLGILYEIRGWDSEAAEQWKKSLSINPEQPKVKKDLDALRPPQD